jgi:hypothetical protein
VDTDPRGVIPPEIFDDEDTDPGQAPSHPEAQLEEQDEDPSFEGIDESEGSGLGSDEQDPSDLPPRTDSKEMPEEIGRGGDAGAGGPEASERKLPRLPWGKMIAVLVYVVGGGSCMLVEHLTSEGAKIERHLREADSLLGERMGSASSVPELVRAAEAYLEVLAIDKHHDLAHRRLDLIKRRFDERRIAFPAELNRRHSAISSRAQLEKAGARKSLFADLPITPGERFGFDDQKRKAKRSSYLYFGGLAALLGWMVVSSSLAKLGTREARGPKEIDEKNSFLP